MNINVIGKIKELIAQNRLEDAFEKTKIISFKSKSVENDFLLLNKRFKSVQNNQAQSSTEENKIEENKITVSFLNLLDKIGGDINVFSLDLIETNEIDFLKSVLNDSFNLVKRIYIFGYTGRNLISNFHNLIFKDKKKKEKKIVPSENLEILLLLKNPYSEDKDRYNQLYDSVNRAKRLRSRFAKNVDLKFYESIPVFRGIICEYEKEETLQYWRSSIITNYYWIPQEKPIASDFSFLNRENLGQKENEYVEQTMSWFNHFWGHKEIHTIIFDFDDTLVETLNIQLTAWAKVIIEFYNDNRFSPELLIESIRSVLEGDESSYEQEVTDIIKDIFLEEQMAGNIFDAIFKGVKEEDKQDLKEKLNERRFEIRYKLTIEEAKFISGADRVIKELSEKYQLVIISSTSEELIEEWLWENNILGYFSKIYGKLGPKDEWENVPEKSKLIIKHSKNSGIPLDRMIYIGDNNTDYKSSRLLNLFFVEARLVAKKYGEESLISYRNNEIPIFFESYKNDSLKRIIDARDNELKKSKWKLNKDYL